MVLISVIWLNSGSAHGGPVELVHRLAGSDPKPYALALGFNVRPWIPWKP